MQSLHFWIKRSKLLLALVNRYFAMNIDTKSLYVNFKQYTFTYYTLLKPWNLSMLGNGDQPLHQTNTRRCIFLQKNVSMAWHFHDWIFICNFEYRKFVRPIFCYHLYMSWIGSLGTCNYEQKLCRFVFRSKASRISSKRLFTYREYLISIRPG